MAVWPRYKAVFWLGLLAMIFLYCSYYLNFIYGVSREVPLKTMHLLKFLFVLIAYGAGVFGLRKNVSPGLMQLWHIIYAGCLLLLVLLGTYDWFITRAPLVIRGIADNVQELLISPILYVGISIVSYRKVF
jgi:hypothetical protein